MFRLTADRSDLAKEFKANPYGMHSPELQAALDQLRLVNPNGKMILVCTQPNRKWILAELRGDPPRAHLLPDMVFESLEGAEWAVFNLRWEILTGQALDVDDDPRPWAASRRSVQETGNSKPVILAYCDRDSARPGDHIDFKVSCEGSDIYCADVVRLVCCDTPTEGPGYKEVKVSCDIEGCYPARRQEISIGSYILVPESDSINKLSSFTVQAMIWPTRPGGRDQALLGTWNAARRDGFGLYLDEMGSLAIRFGAGGPGICFSSGALLAARCWHLVAATFDAGTRTAWLYQKSLPGHGLLAEPLVAKEFPLPCVPKCDSGAFLMAAWIEDGDGEQIRASAHFDGKIDRPRVFAAALPADRVMALVEARLPASLEAKLVAAWDFSADIMSDRVTDRAANGLHGTAVNLPARGVTGFNWTGDTWSWRHAPDQYGAIHFHADDLYDAGWGTDFSLTVPSNMKSGIYAARLRAKGAEFYVPFYLRPPAGQRTAEVLFLVPTATYMAYANNRGRVTSPVTDVLIGKLTVVDEIDLLMLDRPEIGLSTYDAHSDGSSVCYSSRLRPITNHRPKDSDISVAYNNFAADLLIVDWLTHLRVPFDAMTDEDLHQEGSAALEGYRVVVTGTHPEYFSREMLDALEAHTGKGGRLMYLGGNGFYWRVAFRADKPGVVELRRAQLNIGRWNPGPGQYFHSFSGEHGGLWRDLGRPSQRLAGVGFISQGFDASSYYRRTVDALNPRVAFMFDGVEGEIIGNFGLLRGGAAGIEIDRYDERLGSPRHALVVASSENHTNVYEPFEEVLPTESPVPNRRPAVRSDIVFFECPNGGAVFSVGSIAFSGALSHNGYRNNISRLTENVVRRFLDPTPFEMPAYG